LYKALTITLDEIFRYLEEADKFYPVSIDEFQAIAKYLEGAILWTHDKVNFAIENILS
jgi:hypothetical protein